MIGNMLTYAYEITEIRSEEIISKTFKNDYDTTINVICSLIDFSVIYKIKRLISIRMIQ